MTQARIGGDVLHTTESCSAPQEYCGTPNGYTRYRGRCAACREARRLYMRNRRPQRRCSVEGCENAHCALGYCRRHRRAFKLYGDPLLIKELRSTCELPGCTRKHRANGLCAAHHEMARRMKKAPIEWGRKRPRYPAAPIHDFIHQRRAAGFTDERIAFALGLKDKRNVFDLLGREEIREADADRYATALGLHMDVLWPSEEVAA